MPGCLRNASFMQFLSVCISTLTVTSVSTYISWPSPVLPKLAKEGSPIGVVLTENECSWMVSILAVSVPISCLFAPFLIDHLGRKNTLIVSSGILLYPWVIAYTARSAVDIYIARFIGGLAFGCVYTATSLYAAEVAETNIRGKLGVVTNIMKLFGSFMVLSVGPFVTYQTLCLICAFVPTMSLILTPLLPESPYHLVAKGELEKARQVLRELRGDSDDSECIEMKLLSIKAATEKDVDFRGGLLEVARNPAYRKGLLVSIGVKSLNQLCGIAAIEAYMGAIVSESRGGFSPEVSSVVFGAVQIPAAAAASILIDSVGRRPLLIFSSIGSALMLSVLAFYFALPQTADVAWIPTFGIAAYLITVNLGVTTVPTVILGEIFPSNVKTTAISVVTCYGSVLAFLVCKFFRPLCLAVGTSMVLFFFAVCCLCGAMMATFVPETKAKTFAEIQDDLCRRKADVLHA